MSSSAVRFLTIACFLGSALTIASRASADIFTGLDAGATPLVRRFDYILLDTTANFNAYSPSFTGGVRVAAGAVNGDRVPDIVTGAGASGNGHVKVFDGKTNAELRSFFAYGAGYPGGVSVGAGDVDKAKFADIITGVDAGVPPHVKVFSGATGAELRSFFAYGVGFTGGVRVAAGDVTGDGFADVITGVGPGAAAHVKVFDGASGAEVRSFFAYDVGFTGGVFVGAGDVNNDGFADIITGADAGAAPHVKVFSGATGAELRSFFAYGVGFTGGVRVAGGDFNGDDFADIITGAGAGGGGHVKVFDGATGAEIRSFFAYGSGVSQGLFVAHSAVPEPTTAALAAVTALVFGSRRRRRSFGRNFGPF
jgi:serralysin